MRKRQSELIMQIRIFLLNYDTKLENELTQINNVIRDHKKVNIEDILLQYKYLCYRECFEKIMYDISLMLESWENGYR